MVNLNTLTKGNGQKSGIDITHSYDQLSGTWTYYIKHDLAKTQCHGHHCGS